MTRQEDAWNRLTGVGRGRTVLLAMYMDCNNEFYCRAREGACNWSCVTPTLTKKRFRAACCEACSSSTTGCERKTVAGRYSVVAHQKIYDRQKLHEAAARVCRSYHVYHAVRNVSIN